MEQKLVLYFQLFGQSGRPLAHQPLNEIVPFNRTPINAMLSSHLFFLVPLVFCCISVIFLFGLWWIWMCIYAREGGET